LNGITEQRNGCLEDGPRRSDGERARRRGPDEWVVGSDRGSRAGSEAADE
jgi:hypothetical protein